MQTMTCLPDVQHLRCDRIARSDSRFQLQISSVAPSAACPKCGQSSRRVHSHYRRLLRDLP